VNGNFISLRTAHLALAAVGALLGGSVIVTGSAAGQQISGKPAVTDEITIVAPYTVHRKIVGRTTAGIPVEEISLSRKVSFAGLDLTKHADVVEFEKRINDVAKEACKQLNTLYPEALYPPVDTDLDCVKEAVADGLKQANRVIASAGSSTGSSGK
jgi:UrcA family protein